MMIPSPRSSNFKPFKGQTTSKFYVNGLTKMKSQEDYATSRGTSRGPDESSPYPLNTQSYSCPASPLIKPRSSNAVGLISDFYNKDQVGRAIDLVNNLHDRVQVVDKILKRRDEIKEMENQMKLAKAAPVIKGLVSDFRKRMSKNKDNNKSHGQFRKSLFSLFSEDGQYTGEIPTGRVANYSTFRSEKNNIDSPVDTPTKPDPKEDKLYNLMQDTNFKSEREKLSRLETENLSLDSKERVEVLPVSLTSRTPRNHAPFILNKLQTRETEPDADILPKQSLFKDKANNQSDNKPPISSHRRKKRIPAASYELGKEAFKNELCKYFLKHEGETGYYVSNLGQAKQTNIKNIELDVKAKLEALNDHKRSRSMANNIILRRHPSEPVNIKKPPQEEYRTLKNNVKNKKGGDQGNNKQSEKLRKSDEPYFQGDDESFVSFTETRLDHLYRQNHKIQDNLKVLDNKLGNTEPLTHWRKVEKTKVDKLNDLHQNSGEIMKITHKKLSM